MPLSSSSRRTLTPPGGSFAERFQQQRARQVIEPDVVLNFG